MATRHTCPGGHTITGTLVGHISQPLHGMCTHTLELRPDGADPTAPLLHALRSYGRHDAAAAAHGHLRLLSWRGRRVRVHGASLHMTTDRVVLLGVTTIQLAAAEAAADDTPASRRAA
jgi:hypothetical protein